jgi:hypothetical protein
MAALLEPVADGGVADRQDEEGKTGDEKDEVEHGSLPFCCGAIKEL